MQRQIYKLYVKVIILVSRVAGMSQSNPLDYSFHVSYLGIVFPFPFKAS